MALLTDQLKMWQETGWESPKRLQFWGLTHCELLVPSSEQPVFALWAAAASGGRSPPGTSHTPPWRRSKVKQKSVQHQSFTEEGVKVRLKKKVCFLCTRIVFMLAVRVNIPLSVSCASSNCCSSCLLCCRAVSSLSFSSCRRCCRCILLLWVAHTHTHTHTHTRTHTHTESEIKKH